MLKQAEFLNLSWQTEGALLGCEVRTEAVCFSGRKEEYFKFYKVALEFGLQ